MLVPWLQSRQTGSVAKVLICNMITSMYTSYWLGVESWKIFLVTMAIRKAILSESVARIVNTIILHLQVEDQLSDALLDSFDLIK